MKNKTKKIKKLIKDENGLVIVEAAIVFPIMFFVLLFILYIGNVYYEHSRIDSIVAEYAVKGSEYVANPLLYDIDADSGIPTDTGAVHVEPYRYLLSAIYKGETISKIENGISSSVKKEINNGGALFLGGRSATVVGSPVADYQNYVAYSVFVVEVKYEIQFPIRFIFDDAPVLAKLSSRAEASVNDCPEFIRNVDMVVDILDKTGVKEKIDGIFDKVNGFIKKITGTE